jgi:hypothetical protein
MLTLILKMMRTNSIFLLLLICCTFFTTKTMGQYTWHPSDTAWRNNDGQPYPWQLRGRTGIIATEPSEIAAAPKTRYYISNNFPGYLEFLPQGYNDPANASKVYPLLIFLPGCGEINNGIFYLREDDPATPANEQGLPDYTRGLAKVFSKSGYFDATPTHCRESGSYFSRVPAKTIGSSYNMNFGPKEGFIVMNIMVFGGTGLCQPPITLPTVADIEATIDTARQRYRIDPQRVYLTGMSMGGYMPWEFALSNTRNKLAASVPVAGYGAVFNTDDRVAQLILNQTRIFSIVNNYDYKTNGTPTDVITETEITTNLIENYTNYPPGQNWTNYLTKLHFLYVDPATGQPFTSDTLSAGNQPRHSSGRLLTRQEVLDFDANGDGDKEGLQNHDAWTRGYPTRFGDDFTAKFGPPFTDPVAGDFTIYEWMLTQRNSNIQLPVNVVSFTAVRNDAGVGLDWTTATEINSEEFFLERSLDGNNYSKIASLPAAGSSTLERKYTYQDRAVPSAKHVYYRLKQKDKDGKLQVIGVKKVFFGVNGFSARLYPTLATSSLSFEMQSVVNDQLNLRVVDMSGKVLKEQTIPPRQLRTNIDVSSLAKGVYFLQAFNNEHRFTGKFIKD